MRCDGLDILSAGPYADNAPAHEASHRRGRLDLRKTAPGQGSFPHEQCHPGFVEERAKGKSEVLDELPWQTRVARATGARYGRARLGQRSAILDEFDAATGYERKYAIRLLLGLVPCLVVMLRGSTVEALVGLQMAGVLETVVLLLLGFFVLRIVLTAFASR